jgi:hypothetical protein
MMRAVAVGLALLVLAAASCATASAANAPTSLRITIWDTPNATPRVLALRCGPPRGTVVQPALACTRLERLGRRVFEPTPAGTACTMIYGGPQRAVVAGTLDGRKVWASFRRRDGCEIGRWNRVSFLVGTA